jgi:hypothetical protein
MVTLGLAFKDASPGQMGARLLAWEVGSLGGSHL